jgi:hypothetical protein
MRRRLLSSSVSLALALALAGPASAAATAALAAAQAEKPLLKVDADRVTGKIVATFPKPDADGISARYIYLTQLETGLGSAPIGLDRATANESRILVFRRLGKRSLPRSRTASSRPPEVRTRSGRHATASRRRRFGSAMS